MSYIVRVLSVVVLSLLVIGCGGGGTSSSHSVIQADEGVDVNVSKDENSTLSQISINHAPVAFEQKVTTREEEKVAIVLNAEDEDNDSLAYVVSVLPVHGTLSGEAPILEYQPNVDYYGEDSLTYRVSDGVLSSKEVVITLDVEAVNDAPIAFGQNVTIASNQSKLIQLIAEDKEEDNLTYTVVKPPEHGELNGTAPSLTYIPDMGYVGMDQFSYLVDDGSVASEIQEVSIVVTDIPQEEVNITGVVTYDFVPPTASREGLDYSNTVAKRVKQVIMELLDASNNVLQSTVSDENGSYQFTGIPVNMDVKVRAYAKMLQSGSPSWNVKVVDNTQNSALYGLEGALVSSGTRNSQRNLHASSGWNGVQYSEARAAAPFAILDTVYHSMCNVLNVDENTSFPALTVNWSVNNKASAQLIVSNGDIVTSHYNNANLYILGDVNTDTDEYDTYVIAHEWGHYYEDKFSRTDSIGGSHGSGDVLDIRVAFGEGFGNAIAAISHDDPLYFDTYGTRQAMGWNMDIESGAALNAGWYSEGSVQRILYDIYDRNSSDENVDLGFKPMHKIFIDSQKNTAAFTSLFSFITALKNENSEVSESIDQLVASEGINEISDIYGTNRTLLPNHYPYHELTIGTTLENVCLTDTYGYLGSRNKLSNHRYIQFTVNDSGYYQISVTRTNGIGSDPDFVIFRTSPFQTIGYAESPIDDKEQVSGILSVGEYMLDLSDWNTAENACFNIMVEKF